MMMVPSRPLDSSAIGTKRAAYSSLALFHITPYRHKLSVEEEVVQGMGKKTKRQEELEVVTKVEDQEEPEEKKKAKKSRVSTKEKEVVEEIIVRTEEEQENNSNDTPSKIKEEKNNMINTDSFAAYKKMMGKVNPTRAERSRRDNQRKMQAFVKVRKAYR